MMTEEILGLAKYPEFAKIFNLVTSQNPLQSKRIVTFLRNQREDYWIFAEELSRTLNQAILRSEKARLDAATSYNRMCMDILREQIRFRKTGVYLISKAETANQTIYSQPEVMQYYIVGLLLSYLFWPNHYQMWRFFSDHLSQQSNIINCLEVGAGHGLFTAETLHCFPSLEMTVIDISETSLNLAREMLSTFHIDSSPVCFTLGDYLKTQLTEKFDFIIMGEVLEHVNDAPDFMRRTRQLIRENGTVFLSTCVNCPALDHIYHFHNVEEIRILLQNAGFSIIRELALPAEAVSEAMWEEELVTINYCAILAPIIK
jgi:ubiquinone/menaquinone biosynthesis C-methylase UbiE